MNLTTTRSRSITRTGHCSIATWDSWSGLDCHPLVNFPDRLRILIFGLLLRTRLLKRRQSVIENCEMNNIESLKAQLSVIRLRVRDAHTAMRRATQSTPNGAYQSCQDDSYTHLAIQNVLQQAVDVSNGEFVKHIAAQDERLNRLEAEIARLRSAAALLLFVVVIV